MPIFLLASLLRHLSYIGSAITHHLYFVLSVQIKTKTATRSCRTRKRTFHFYSLGVVIIIIIIIFRPSVDIIPREQKK